MAENVYQRWMREDNDRCLPVVEGQQLETLMFGTMAYVIEKLGEGPNTPILGLSDKVLHGALSISAAMIVRSSFAEAPSAPALEYTDVPNIPRIPAELSALAEAERRRERWHPLRGSDSDAGMK
ncbi:hypothetical protein ACVW1C_002324 [Bradyrhizobium sp. USDA 4011]